jgi:linoleoyl-CoA desaturase
MKKTRFVAPNPQEQQFAQVLRAKVNAYFKEKGISPKANTAVVFQALNMLALYFAPFVLILVLPLPGWLAALFAVVSGFGLAGIGMCVMHGGNHEAISRYKWLNNLLGLTMNVLGNSAFTWKVKHNQMHHTFTNIEGLDGDISSSGALRLGEHAPLNKIHRFQFIHAFPLYCLLSISMFINDFIWLMDFRRQGLLKKQNVKFGSILMRIIAIKVLYMAVFIGLPILLTDFAWWQVLIGWLMMHFTGGFILGVTFQLAHVVEGLEQPLPSTEGVIAHDWVIHEMRTTSNFARNNRLLSWYVGGLNFQIEHHIFPNICHVHYRKIAPIVEATAKEYGVPYHLKRTLWAAIISHARKLYALGRVGPVAVSS